MKLVEITENYTTDSLQDQFLYAQKVVYDNLIGKEITDKDGRTHKIINVYQNSRVEDWINGYVVDKFNEGQAISIRMHIEFKDVINDAYDKAKNAPVLLKELKKIFITESDLPTAFKRRVKDKLIFNFFQSTETIYEYIPFISIPVDKNILEQL